MDISWEDAKLFLAVAETGSLSGAARRLTLGQPTVTRRLAQLEYTVGAKLFLRSVEGAALTSAGERLLVPAKKMAEWAGELQRAAEARDGAPRGLVRVTASPFACFDFLAAFAGFVGEKHPGLRLEVLSTIQYLDLVRGEADLALRGRPPQTPDLKVLHRQTMHSAVYVSKRLAAKLPKKPALVDLPWVAWAPPFESVTPNPQLEAAIPQFTPAFTADSYLVQYAAADAGLGAIVLPLMSHRFSRPSSLVPLEIDLGPHAKQELYLVAARSALDTPRIRRVGELLVTELERTARR